MADKPLHSLGIAPLQGFLTCVDVSVLQSHLRLGIGDLALVPRPCCCQRPLPLVLFPAMLHLGKFKRALRLCHLTLILSPSAERPAQTPRLYGLKIGPVRLRSRSAQRTRV